MRRAIAILILIGVGSLLGIIAGIPPFVTVVALAALLYVLHRFGAIPEGSLFMAFVDLAWAPGKQNMAGLVGDLYHCPVDDILTWPDLSAAGKLDTDPLTPFVCKTGKKFQKIYHTPDTGEVRDGTVGEIDGKSKENFCEFFHPGNSNVVDEFERSALNTPSIVLGKDTDGQVRCLGIINLDDTTVVLTSEIAAYLDSATGTTGKARADRRGKTFIWKHNAGHAPIYYTGVIPLTAAP